MKAMENNNNTEPTGKETIEVIMGYPLIKEGNHVFYLDKKRIPEIRIIKMVDFTHHCTFRFLATELRKSEYAKARENFLSDIFIPINRRLLERNPELISGNDSLRYIWVEEFGESEHIHIHLLLYVDKRVRDIVDEDVRSELRKLEENPMKGVESVVITDIKAMGKEDQARVCAYPFKVEFSVGNNREKQVYYSMGFQRVIERHFLDPRKLDKNSEKNGKN